MLERLVQQDDLQDTHLVEASVPDDLAVEDATAVPPPGWHLPSSEAAAARGTAWLRGGRAALLRVPSVIVPREPNYVVNPKHPDAGRIVVGSLEILEWDARLLQRRTTADLN